MPKEKIAIISLLKPVDDVRSYHKMAKSFSQSEQYEIHLLGYPSQNHLKSHDNIYFHSYPSFSRLNLKRLLVPLNALQFLIQLKPRVTIVNSPELLWVAALSRILFGHIIIYDIQENYYRNLRYQTNYSFPVNHILALLIRSFEYVLSPLLNHFILAEKCYATELNFIRDKWTIIENKALSVIHDSDQPKGFKNSNTKLLFSGTITKNTGIHHAIKVYDSLRKHGSYELEIIGHCPDPKLKSYLQKLESKEFVKLHISDSPIPYSKIQRAISHTEIALVTYELNPSNEKCMPTKVYEYLTNGVPIIYESNAHWHEIIQSYEMGIPIEFDHIDEKKVSEAIYELRKKEKINKRIKTWESEQKKLLKLIKKLLK